MERREMTHIAARLHDIDAELGELVKQLDGHGEGRVAARLIAGRRQIADGLILLLEVQC